MKWLADDPTGGIALEALCSRVPAPDDTICTKHKDGIVDNGIDEQFKAVSLARCDRVTFGSSSSVDLRANEA